MKKLLILLCWLLIAEYMFSAGSNYSFKSLDIDKGLSHSNVTSILADSRGALWIGTIFGLNCYDRHEMRSYFYQKEDPFSIPGNFIFFVTEDLQNTLWVSTDRGLVRYDKTHDRFMPAIADKRINTYSFCSTDKNIWFGEKDKLYCYDYQDKEMKEISLDAKDRITSEINFIFEWKEGVLLLVTRCTGIWEYHYHSGILRESVFPLQPFDIMTTYLDGEKNLYLSNFRNGLSIFDRNGKLRRHITTENSQLTNNLILDVVEREGNLWLATDGGGINILSLKPPYSISSINHIPGNINSLPCNSICRLYKDQQNNIWAGSVRNGVSEIKNTFISTFKEVPPGNVYGLTSQAVGDICKDEQGFVWVGTDGGGINRFDPKSQTFKHFPTTYNEKVTSIAEYSSSELLVSLYNNGVYLFEKATGKLIPFTIVDAEANHREYHSGYLQYVYRISSDRFFFLSYTPYIYNKQSREFSTLKTKEDPKYLLGLRMVAVTDENAYFLRRYQLLSADLKTDSLSILFSMTDKEEMRVADRDEDGIFWIGTDRGLRRFDPQTQKLEIIQTNLFERVSAIVAKNGILWIGAQNTLFSYDIHKQKFAVWQESDGFLPNDLMSSCYTHISDLYTYIGGNHGLVQIQQSIVSTSSDYPKLELADVMMDGLSLWSQQKEEKQDEHHFSVPWNYKTLQMRIVSIEQDFFKKRLFRYTLHSSALQDKEIKTIETYDPTLSLDVLAPGEYSIYASCYTDDGIWSPPSRLLYLRVMPPWFKDYRILLPAGVLLLAILCWLVYLFILRKEEKMKWKMSEVIQKADQEKVQFLINISHELRTPLTLIYAPLKKVIEKVDGEVMSGEEWRNIKKQLTNIYRSANQMKNIINLTLDINRISDEENTLQKRSHVLNEWIYSVAEEFKYELEAKQVDLKYALDESIGTLEFDDYKCESVLSNMLMNALKFAPAGSRIILTSTLTEGGVRVSVSDQGVGLGNLDPRKLFTRFYQGEQSQGGSGIGLAYAKTLIQKHGGTIGAFNNPDVGATFYFELPLSPAAATQSSADIDVPLLSFPLMEGEMAATEDFSMKPYTVLVVEDNDELRHFLADSLKEDFRNVYQAVNGQEAWKSIGQRIPDIIISDIMMPLMDGYELCRNVKAEPATSHIPVVLLTARGDKDSTSAGYKLGADAYLSKPFDLDFLLVILRNQLRSREMMKMKYRETYLRVADDAPTQVIGNSDEEFLLKFNKLVLDHLSSKELDVKFLTEQMNMSRSPLYNKLKALTNMGVNDYINRLRIEKASELLQHSPTLTISEISDEVGFEYQRYFSTIFKQTKGMTPTQFRLQVVGKQDKEPTSGQ